MTASPLPGKLIARAWSSGMLVFAVLAVLDRPEALHLLKGLQARHLTCGHDPRRYVERTPAIEHDRTCCLGLCSGEGRAYELECGPLFQLGREDIGMSQDANSAVHALQDAHQATRVIIMAVAEADEIEMAEVEIQGIRIMQHHLRGGARVHEQLHPL